MILSFLGQYHGESTYLAAANSTDTSVPTTGNAEYVPGFVFAPYPAVPGAVPPRTGAVRRHPVPGLHRELAAAAAGRASQIAAVLIEPVAGEAGILAPSAEFWRGLTALCREHGWLLILDEVQTCLGRCGTVFAADLWGLEPDILLLGQVAHRRRPGDRRDHGDRGGARRVAHAPGGTYAWEPAACAAALAGLDLLDGGVLDNVKALDAVAREELVPLVERFEQVGDVRPLGAWVTVEFVTDKATIAPDPAFQWAVHQSMLRRGVLAISEDNKPLYRMQPALTMPPELFRWSCRQLAAAVAEVAGPLIPRLVRVHSCPDGCSP